MLNFFKFFKDENVYTVPMSGTWGETVLPIVCCSLMGLFLTAMSLGELTGHGTAPRVEGAPGLDPVLPSLIAGTCLLGYALYLGHQVLFRGVKPFVFDRRADQLRRGDTPLCRLSEIRRVLMVKEAGEEGPLYSLSFTLEASRRVGFGPSFRFRDPDWPDLLKREIEAFLKLPAPES